MSCPADNAPMQARLEQALGDEDIELPVSFYLMTLGMLATVAIIPFIYQHLWMIIFDFIEAIRYTRKGPLPPPGCVRMGKPADRNLSKEFRNKLDSGGKLSKDGQDAKSKVEALFQYPIKSCYGIEVDRAEVLESGFEYDRQFCFAQHTTSQPDFKTGKIASTWNMVSQRTNPALTTVKTEIWVPDSTLATYKKDSEEVKSEGCLQLSFPFAPFLSWDRDGLKGLRTILIAKIAYLSLTAEPRIHIRIPFKPDADRIKSKGYGKEDVKIHKDVFPQALDMRSEIEPDALAKLKYFLGVSNPFTLFRVNPNSSRPLFKCAPTKEQLGYQVKLGLTDSYPLHILNIASILDLESKVPQKGPFTKDSRRYRGNIYISGVPAYAEDDWTLIKIGTKEYHVSSRTPRCKLPNTNPDTGTQDVKGNQPNSTMSRFRVIDEGTKNPCLGMMIVPSEDAVGQYMRTGHLIEVLKTGDHHFVSSAAKKDQQPVI